MCRGGKFKRVIENFSTTVRTLIQTCFYKRLFFSTTVRTLMQTCFYKRLFFSITVRTLIQTCFYKRLFFSITVRTLIQTCFYKRLFFKLKNNRQEKGSYTYQSIVIFISYYAFMYRTAFRIFSLQNPSLVSYLHSTAYIEKLLTTLAKLRTFLKQKLALSN